MQYYRGLSLGMRKSINTVVDQKYWSILLLFIALHFLWAYLTISFFPIIGIEEPGYTIHSYNLATKGKLINEFFKDCNLDYGWTLTIDEKILWPPLYPILLSWYFSLHFFDKFRALLLVLLIETNILFRFISQEARPDIWVATSSLLMVMFLLKYKNERKRYYLCLSSAFASVAILLHWSGALVIGSFVVLLILYCFIRKKILFRKLLFPALTSLVLLLPYIIYIGQNFALFEIQVIGGALNQTKQPFLSDRYSSSLFIVFALVCGLSFFVDKQKPEAIFLRDVLFALVLLMLILTFKFRYTLITLPLCMVILASVVPAKICFIKDYHIIIAATVASLVFSVGYMHPMSQLNESYWKITRQIDSLIGANSKVIGHPLIQWGLNPIKYVEISECDDIRSIDLDDFDYVIAERYFQGAMRKWSDEAMSKLNLVYHDESKTYNFKVYKIIHRRGEK